MGKLVVCDECVPRGISALLADEAEVTTVAALGLAGRTDLEVLSALQRRAGTVLVTVDRGFRWTRREQIGRVSVVLLHARSNQLIDLLELMPTRILTNLLANVLVSTGTVTPGANPNAELDLDVSAFGRVCCAMLDIPVHQSLKESLHVFFTL